VEQQNKMAAIRNQNKMASIVEEQSKSISSNHFKIFSLKGYIFIITFTWWSASQCLYKKVKAKTAGEG
jgi:hypothetical protein